MRSSKVLAPRAEVPLASLGTLGVGGAARWFIRAEHADDVAAARTWCEEQKIPWFVLGGGSNVVISDAGFDVETVKRVVRMVNHNEYKRRQGPLGVKITPRAFGRDWRLPIVNRFREE